MRIVLKVADGPYAGRTVLLQTGQTVKVGRTEWADFCLPHDERISSVHFALECDRDRSVVRDLDSTNGTTLNGSPVAEADLQDGDVIFAGTTTFHVAIEITESVVDMDPITLSTSAGGSQPDQPDAGAPLNDKHDAAIEETAAIDETASPQDTDPKISDAPSRRSIESAALLTAVDRPPVSTAQLLASGSQRPYAAALEDPDPDVRREAIFAAAWTGERWLLEYLRSLAQRPQTASWDALHLFAILGEPSDLERIVRIGRNEALGSRRFAVYGSYGHPRLVRDLLVAMEGKDVNAAVAAGVAFTKMTGADIDSEERVELPPEDGSEPDEFEKEFLEDAFLPDAQLARQHWSKVKDAFDDGTRWRRGINLSSLTELPALGELDMEGRHELSLRMAYHGLPYRHLLPGKLRSQQA